MKKIVFFIAIAIFFALASPLCRAQGDFLVRGQVIAHGPGVGLEGALVRLVDSDISTTAGEEGMYQLTVPSWKTNRRLRASFEGCFSETKPAAKYVNFDLIAKDLMGLILFISKFASDSRPIEGYGEDGETALT